VNQDVSHDSTQAAEQSPCLPSGWYWSTVGELAADDLHSVARVTGKADRGGMHLDEFFFPQGGTLARSCLWGHGKGRIGYRLGSFRAGHNWSRR